MIPSPYLSSLWIIDQLLDRKHTEPAQVSLGPIQETMTESIVLPQAAAAAFIESGRIPIKYSWNATPTANPILAHGEGTVIGGICRLCGSGCGILAVATRAVLTLMPPPAGSHHASRHW